MADSLSTLRVRLALRGKILTPTASSSAEYLGDGVVLADQDGRIQFVGSYRAARKRYAGPIQDVRPGLIVPGFVDTHLHFPQTRIIGRATGTLLSWLEQTVFPEEARFRRPAYARAVADEFLNRLIAAGTTTAAVFSSSNPRATSILFEALEARGMRAMAGLTLMDKHCPQELSVSRQTALKASRKLATQWHGYDDDRLRYAITPRFALSCSRKMLAGAGRLAAELDLPVQTHVAETRAEGEATLAAHPYADNYVDVYERNRLLTGRTILAHAIHLSRTEWSRVGRAGASIAHCPDSNFFLGSGRMRLSSAARHGVAVGLGSDVAAGRSFSMRRAMAYAYDNAVCLGAQLEPAELFRLATLGGAEALGWQQRIGSLEQGKDADIVVVPLSPRAKTRAEVLAELVFDTDSVDAALSFVRGRRL